MLNVLCGDTICTAFIAWCISFLLPYLFCLWLSPPTGTHRRHPHHPHHRPLFLQPCLLTEEVRARLWSLELVSNSNLVIVTWVRYIYLLSVCLTAVIVITSARPGRLNDRQWLMPYFCFYTWILSHRSAIVEQLVTASPLNYRPDFASNWDTCICVCMLCVYICLCVCYVCVHMCLRFSNTAACCGSLQVSTTACLSPCRRRSPSSTQRTYLYRYAASFIIVAVRTLSAHAFFVRWWWMILSSYERCVCIVHSIYLTAILSPTVGPETGEDDDYLRQSHWEQRSESRRNPGVFN